MRMTLYPRVAVVPLVVLAVGLLGCGRTPHSPLSPALVAAGGASASAPADRCVNVAANGTATLAFPVVLPDGTVGFGADWFPVTLGGISGEMASVVITEEISGSQQQGARHLTLKHAFRTASGDYFMTVDRAVCAPADNNPGTCRVNDVLTIAAGTGIFSNPSGSLRNHGTIDFAAGTLDFSLRGRVCGDGV